MNQDDTLTTIDLLTETLNQCSDKEVVDFATYVFKNLDYRAFEMFIQGLPRVKK
jgi:hypothetical protein